MVKIILQRNLSECEEVSEMADVEEVAMLPPQTDQEEDAGGQRENNSKESTGEDNDELVASETDEASEVKQVMIMVINKIDIRNMLILLLSLSLSSDGGVSD